MHTSCAYERRNLEWNQLTGAIPISLGSLSSLVLLCAPMCLLLARARAWDGTHATRGINVCSGLRCGLVRCAIADAVVRGSCTTRHVLQGSKRQSAHGRDPGLARLALKPSAAVRARAGCVRMRRGGQDGQVISMAMLAPPLLLMHCANSDRPRALRYSRHACAYVDSSKTTS
jgi:hypothetical protein